MILEDEIVDLKTEADALVPGIGQYLTGDTVLPDCPPDVLRELFAVLPVDQLDKIVASKNPYFSWFSACYALFLIGDYEYSLNPFVDSPETIAAVKPKIDRARRNYTQQHDGRRLTLTTFLSKNGKKSSYFDRALKDIQPRPVARTPAPSRTTFEIATTAAAKLLVETLSGNPVTYPDRHGKVSNNSKIKCETKIVGKGTSEEKTMLRMSQSYPSGLVRSYQIDDVRLIATGTKPAKTMFYQALKKLVHFPMDKEGHLQAEELRIPMKELVDRGVYSTINSARTGFDVGFTVLSAFTYSEHGRTPEPSALRPFPEHWIEKGVGVVTLSPNADWRPLLEEYSFIPDYFDSLSDFAQDLLFEIVVFARQRYDEIKKNGYFDIKISTFQNNLGLPSEDEVRNVRRDIVEKIQAGLNEIEDAEAKRASRKEDNQPAIMFALSGIPALEANFDDYGVDAKPREYLDEGRIRIYFSGDLKDPLIKMSDTREKKIKQYRKKRSKKSSKNKSADNQK